ncbi:hypothetical protein [Candidatus Protochlamydia phocaeensis]|uniref:hypothetical protein n=1 Tax=Candidatus Protochlamydia phocaeensis TaxID=1414722 RepID=UPI0008390C9B|nr:hypothetical protein [Candidatus Protochlamydia phocaeensis]
MTIQTELTFFNYYILFPYQAPSPRLRQVYWISSIAIGILTAGIVHAACALVYTINKMRRCVSSPARVQQQVPLHLAFPSQPPNPINHISRLLADKWALSPFDEEAKTDQEIRRNKPFKEWIPAEYKFAQSPIRKNLEELLNDRPALKQALFLGIRGDGDCTSRALGIGLLLQQTALQPSPLASLQAFCQQLQGIRSWLELEAQSQDNALTAQVRSQLQARLPQFFERIDQLLARCTAINVQEEILACCQDEAFNRAFISFLKTAAALYVFTNRDKLPNSCSNTLLIESEGHGNEEAYLRDKVETDQPFNPALFGNLTDAYALSQLFNQSIHWIRIQRNSGSPEHRPIIAFNAKESPQSPLYILNRPGHSDLLLL